MTRGGSGWPRASRQKRVSCREESNPLKIANHFRMELLKSSPGILFGPLPSRNLEEASPKVWNCALKSAF